MQLNSILKKLRSDSGISQERFAETVGVSQQAVQKWETGVAIPDVDKLVKISKYFNVTLDYLLLGKDERATEVSSKISIVPNVEIAGNWELYSESLMQEYYQCVQEGKDVKKYKDLFKTVSGLERSELKSELADAIFNMVINAPECNDFKYNEPSDSESIKALRKPYSVKNAAFDKGKMFSKVYGAWLGRVIGCRHGAVVECCGYNDLVNFLKATDNYPMHRYIYSSDAKKINQDDYSYNFNLTYYVDNFKEVTCGDDDTNYTVLAQIIVNTYGREFTAFDVARAWLAFQIRDEHATAEKIAYSNLINGYYPPDSALYKNPYREWIGAQIRGDYFGYINPGNPEAAADMAFKDASVSHVKNGIYGEMFIAAAIATAAVTDNIEDIILSGLAQIPATSRLYEDIMTVYDGYKAGKSKDEMFTFIHNKYDTVECGGWVHTNSNAMIVVASLLYGEKDFGKSICMAVETGFDTDCNAATIGSILGMAIGVESIPDYWKEPIKDKMRTGIYKHETVEISECAKQTLKHIKYPD